MHRCAHHDHRQSWLPFWAVADANSVLSLQYARRSRDARMRIGELAKLANTSAKTIRFYEDSGLLPRPARTASGYRDYAPEIVDRLRFIHRGQPG